MDMGKHTGLALYKGPTRKQLKAREARAARKVITTVRDQLVALAEGFCQRCGLWVGDYGHAHHLIKRSQGGTWTLGNLRYLCARCHGRAHGVTV